MNCFSHSGIASVATCQGCGKGLCVTCASYYKLPACNICHRNFKQEASKEILKEILSVLLLGAIVIFLCTQLMPSKDLNDMMFFANIYSKKSFSIVYAYAAVATVVGWRALTNLKTNYFLFLPIIGWLIYIFIKLQVSFFFGVFYTPIWFAKKITKLIRVYLIPTQK